MRRYWSYCLIPMCWLLLSCGNFKRATTLHLPQGLDSNFRSSQVKRSFSKKSYPVQVLGYRAFSDSLISSEFKDSALTYGIILPASSIVASGEENRMVFGTDSIQCNIHYITLHIYKSEEQSSFLFDIILPPDKKAPYDDRYKTTTTTYKKLLTGSMLHPVYKDEISFYFDMLSIRKNFDSADVHGYLKIQNDSFVVRALYNEIPLHGKNVKPMQILQGYSLIKADTLYGFLQHAPMVKSKDELFINTKAPQNIQMLVAAYLSLVSQLVYSTANERIF